MTITAHHTLNTIFLSSSGLGLSTAGYILQEKGYVAILDIKPPDATTVDLAPSRAKFWELNITKVDDITKVVDEVISWTKQNGAPLGGVINCAGVGTAAKVGREPNSREIFRTLTVN